MEVPDSCNMYLRIDATNPSSSPLAFALVLGYFLAFSADPDLDAFMSRIMADASLSSSAEFAAWVTSLKERRESWMGDLKKSKELQKTVEKLLTKECKVQSKEKFEAIHLPQAANLLQCNVMYHCPYMYQKLLVKPQSEEAKYTIVVSMDSPNVLKLYMKEESVDSDDYLREMIRLKQEVIKSLVSEYGELYGACENILANKPIEGIQKQSEGLDNAIDRLIEFKKSKAGHVDKQSKLLTCLEKIKEENVEIAGILLSLQPKEEPKESNATSAEEYKLPCMSCKKCDSKITELACGHTTCSDCLTALINDKEKTNKAFVLKCPVRYCFYIVSPVELKATLDEAAAEELLAKLSSMSTPESCLVCQKSSSVNIHDGHSLCNECLSNYVRYNTNSEMIILDPSTNEATPVNCPMKFSCGVDFGHGLYKELLSAEQLARLGRREAGSVGGCYECGLSGNVARLHSDCELCFCPSHCKELGRKIFKSESIFGEMCREVS